MSSTMKISLLALAAAVNAVPQYGYGHGRFHSSLKATDKPYPTAPYPTGYGSYNSTAAPYATGAPYPSAPYGQDTTIEDTTTSTKTVYSTVHLKASVPVQASSAAYEAATSAVAQAKEVTTAANDYCAAPVTVTVYAPEKVTVTLKSSAGYEAPAPSSVYAPAPPASAAPVESKPAQGYSSAPAQYPAETPKATSSEVQAYAAQTTAVYQAPSSVAAPAPSSAAPPSSGNTYAGVKRGLAYNDASACKSLGGKFGFGYNWGQVENNDIGTSFIPMMHSPSKSSAEEWLANVDKAVKKGSTAVMGFNECDHPEQCNLSPEAACSAWKEYMNPIKSKYPDVTIIGPSVTNGGAPMGLDWLTRFQTACPDATHDATNIHFYDIYEEATIDRFKAQVEKAASNYGKKVWITELGLNPGSASADQAATFLKEVMAYCDNADHVQGYSWYKADGGDYGLTIPSMASLYASS